MQYRRDFTGGASYFFTVVTFRRRPIFAESHAVERLRTSFRQEIARRPFQIDAIVIMPDHIHAIWTLPQDDCDYSMRWRNIKRSFTATIPDDQRPEVGDSRQHKNEQAIWQRRFWEHRIRDESDFTHHVDYIHFNPVKHGYVKRPNDWPYSSIHRYMRQGIITPDWGCSPIIIPDNIGQE